MYTFFCTDYTRESSSGVARIFPVGATGGLAFFLGGNFVHLVHIEHYFFFFLGGALGIEARGGGGTRGVRHTRVFRSNRSLF